MDQKTYSIFLGFLILSQRRAPISTRDISFLDKLLICAGLELVVPPPPPPKKKKKTKKNSMHSCTYWLVTVCFCFFYLAYFVPLFFVDLKSFEGGGGQAAENPLGAVYGDSVFWVVTKGGWPTNDRSLRTPAEEEALLRPG